MKLAIVLRSLRRVTFWGEVSARPRGGSKAGMLQPISAAREMSAPPRSAGVSPAVLAASRQNPYAGEGTRATEISVFQNIFTSPCLYVSVVGFLTDAKAQ